VKCHRRRSDAVVAFEMLEPRLLLAADWTLMVYLDGDCDLEGAGIEDVNEMEAVGSTDDVNILVQFDRTEGHDSSNGNWKDTRRGRIIRDSSTSTITTPFASVGELNMGHPNTLTQFIQWGATNYAADHYAIILWDHGGGTTGVCWDDTSNDHLSVAEVGDALAASGVHMDIVGFDACLMGMIETAYEVAGYGDIVVASEQTEPWDGWSYDAFLSDLVDQPSQSPEELAESIVTTYGESYHGAETQSAVGLAQVKLLAAELDNFAATVIAEDTDWGAISAARTEANYYSDPDFRDLGTFVDAVASYATNANIISAATSLAAQYNATVLANHSSSAEAATGLSVYLPAQGGEISRSYTADAFDLLAETRWDDFLDSFVISDSTGTDLDGSMGDANDVGVLPATLTGQVGLDGGEDVGGKDVDFFALSVAAGQEIGFDVDAKENGSSLDAVIRLFDSSGTQLAMNDDAYDPDSNIQSFDPYIEQTFTKSETVYVAVSGYANASYDPHTTGSGSAGATGAYTLLIRNVGSSATDVNGTIPTATALGSAPANFHAQIGDEPVGDKDVDFYAIDVESNQGLTVTLSTPGSDLDADLKLFAADGTLLATDGDDGDGQIDYDSSETGAGVYYVAVSGKPNIAYDPFALDSAVSGSIGTYTINVVGYSVHLDFDGVIQRANDVGAPPADMLASIGDEPVGALDVDIYAVTVAAGETVSFDIDSDELGWGLDSTLRLFDTAGNQLAISNADADGDTGFVGLDPYIEYTFQSGGTCYIAVSGAPNSAYLPMVEASGVSGSQGDYELHIRHLGTGNDVNGTIATAQVVSVVPATLAGAIGDEPADRLDVDFYAVSVTAGQRLGFDVDARESGSNLDSILRLFDSAGIQLAKNDDANDPDTGQYTYDSYLHYTFQTAGTYYIAVSGYDNGNYDPNVELSGIAGSRGNYDLLVRVLDDSVQDHTGPDAFGYMAWAVEYEFEDILMTGTEELPFADDDTFHLNAKDLDGFEFDFYGTTYGELYVSSNGLITFGSANDAYNNTNLTASPSQAAIAPLWDDLYMGNWYAGVLWEVLGTGDQQRLVVQWESASYITGSDVIIFQAVLDASDSSIQFNYESLGTSALHGQGASASVGIKDAGTQSVGQNMLQVSINAGPNCFVGDGRSTRIAAVEPSGGQIQGCKYNDLNGNGTRNAGESGLAGWTMYIDTNDNAQYDLGEAYVTTDDEGAFVFTDLQASTYTIAEIPRVGWEQTAPSVGAGGVHTVELQPNQIVEGIDFGNHFVGDQAEINVQLRVVTDLYGSDQMSDAAFDTYASITGAPLGSTYYAELWLRDTGLATSGIAGGSVNLVYTTTPANAVALGHGTVYTLSTGGTIDDGNGLVDNFGGATDLAGQGAAGWVRMGWVQIASTGAGDATFVLQPGGAPFTEFEGSDVDWTDVALDIAPHTVGSEINAIDDAVGIAEDAPTTQINVMTNDLLPHQATVTDVSAPTHGTVTIVAGGTAISYQPDADFNGTDSFAYTIADSAGSDTATVTILVSPVNDAPIPPDQAVQTDVGEAVDVALVDEQTDVETAAEDLAVTITDAPDHGTLTDIGGGMFRYQPYANYVGPDRFAYTITDDGDPAGAEDNAATSPAATVYVTVGRRVDLDAKGRAGFLDASGDWVQIALKGSAGSLYFADTGACDVGRIVLEGTGGKSSLKVQAGGDDGRTSITDVDILGSLKSLAASCVDLIGNLTATGFLCRISLGSATDAVISTGQVGRPAGLKIDTVTDTSMLFAGPIKMIKANEWWDTDGTADRIVYTGPGEPKVKVKLHDDSPTPSRTSASDGDEFFSDPAKGHLPEPARREPIVKTRTPSAAAMADEIAAQLWQLRRREGLSREPFALDLLGKEVLTGVL